MKRRFVCLALLAGISAAVSAQIRISVDVQLQQLTVTVRDEKGSLVRNLTVEDFSVEENGKPQTIAHFSEDAQSPISLGLLVDTSGSMEEAVAGNLTGLRAAEGVATLLMRLMNPADEFALMSFADRFRLEEKFTTDKRTVAAALKKFKAENATNLFQAIERAFPEVRKGKHRKKALIVITDALVSGDMDRLRRNLRSAEMLVYTFALHGAESDVGPYDTKAVLDALAGESGGRSEIFDMRSDRFVDQLVGFVEEIAAELRSQYTVGFYASSGDGPSDLRIRTRYPNYSVRFAERER